MTDGFEAVNVTEEDVPPIMKSEDRVRILEAKYPELKFTRLSDGSVMGWGSVPEQATGTINGNPFYYRLRGNAARLQVWDASEIDVESVPSLWVDVIQEAYNDEIVPGDHYLGWSYDEKVFEALLNDLSDVEVLNSQYRAQQAREAGVASIGAVARELDAQGIALTYVERDERYKDDIAGAFLLPSGAGIHVAITQLYDREEQMEKDGLICGMTTPDENPLVDRGGPWLSIQGDTSSAHSIVGLLRSLRIENARSQRSLFTDGLTEIETELVNELFCVLKG